MRILFDQGIPVSLRRHLAGTNPGQRYRYVRRNGPYTLVMSATGINKLPYGNLPRPVTRSPSQGWLCRLASSSSFPPPMQPKLRGSDFYPPISSTSPISRRTSWVRSLVFTFATVPRNDTRFDAVDNLDPALERPLISRSGPSANSVTRPGARESRTLCAHHPWQQLPVYHYTNLLATLFWGEVGPTELRRRRSRA